MLPGWKLSERWGCKPQEFKEIVERVKLKSKAELPHLAISPWPYVLTCRGVQLFVTQWSVARQAPLSMGLCWQEHGSELPLPPLGNLSEPGIEPCLLWLLHWQADCLPPRHLGSPISLWERNIIQGCFVDAQLSCVAVVDWYSPLSEVLLEDPALPIPSIKSLSPTTHVLWSVPLL